MSGGIFIYEMVIKVYNSTIVFGRAHIGGDLFTKVLVLKQPILVFRAA